MATMRALTFSADSGVVFRTDYPKPARQPGEALIRMVRAGICKTDVEITKGYAGFSGVLGHEFLGVVEEIEDGCHVNKGQRVTGDINLSCDHCDVCTSGGIPARNHCPNRTVLGIIQKDGVFADYVTLPVKNLHAVPDHMTDECAVFAEPLGAAFRIVEQGTAQAAPRCTDGCEGTMMNPTINGSSAFCVTRTGGRVQGPLNPFVFNENYVNYKSTFDPSTNQWRASHSGHYFFHLSAGAYPNSRVNMTMSGGPYPVHTVRDSTYHQYDVLSRDALMYLTEDEVVTVQIDSNSSVNCDAGRPTMWAGFDVDGFMNGAAVFYASSHTYQKADEGPTTLTFEDELIDIQDTFPADNFNPGQGIFTAPWTGTYFFFFSTGVEPFTEHRSHFVSDRDTDDITELWRGLSENPGVDTLSKSIIYYLDAGQTMKVQLVGGQATNNQSTLLSFGGFHYLPKHASVTPKQAWMLATDTSHTGPEDPLVYEKPVVNTDGLYDVGTSKITIAASGYYYMSFYAGVTASDPLALSLVRTPPGGSPAVVADVRRDVAYNTYPDTLGRSVMLHLVTGDVIHVRVESGGTVFSDTDTQTVFSGLLLYGTESP